MTSAISLTLSPAGTEEKSKESKGFGG
jgi:hypothetical protein